MRNALFATTALVAAGFAGSAFAAEPMTLSVGGYMHAGVGYVDDGTDSDIGVMRDGEIQFTATGSSDNGLTFRARVELEAYTDANTATVDPATGFVTGIGGNDQIDENWVSVGGAFGTVKIGGDDHASYNLATGVLFSSGAKIGHYDDFGESNITYVSNNRFSDAIGIHYTTPTIAGITGGVSYHPGGGDGTGDGTNLITGDADVISLGLNVTQDLGGFGFTLSGGYDMIEGAPAGAEDDGFTAGAEVVFAGFTVGGLYIDGVGIAGEENYVANAAYSTGPWAAGIGYSLATEVAPNVDHTKYAGWVGYALAPGVRTSIGVEMSEQDGADTATTAMGWISLSF